jgi:hypothetical protein
MYSLKFGNLRIIIAPRYWAIGRGGEGQDGVRGTG